jgi:Protein of unknown function (DUF3168).
MKLVDAMRAVTSVLEQHKIRRYPILAPTSADMPFVVYQRVAVGEASYKHQSFGDVTYQIEIDTKGYDEGLELCDTLIEAFSKIGAISNIQEAKYIDVSLQQFNVTLSNNG